MGVVIVIVLIVVGIIVWKVKTFSVGYEESVSSMHEAAESGNVEEIKRLADSGVDVDIMDKLEKTPMHYAVRGRKVECIKLLAALGGDVDAKDVSAIAPIHEVLRWSSMYSEEVIAVIKCLAELGANVNASDGHGRTPIQYVSDTGVKNCLKSLGAY